MNYYIEMNVDVLNAPSDRNTREMLADRISCELCKMLAAEFPEFETVVSIESI